MTCKLCLKNHELQESHIISEAFFESVYDSKHRAIPISIDSSEIKFVQNGIKEKLLCRSCEQKLGRWETILKRDLVDIGNKNSRFLKIIHINDELLKIEKIRYKEFKLAILSILWRMSITSRPFFESYKLGVYEEKLRIHLLNEHNIDERKYPILVSRYEIDQIFNPGMIGGFPSGKYDQIFTVQSFMIWSHRFIVFMNDKKFPKIPVEKVLRNSGELLIEVCSIVDLASPKSVLSKIYDKKVESIYLRMK
jgi:hypothetical protein